MSLALNEYHEIDCSPFKVNCYLQACTIKRENKLLILCARQPMKIIRDQLPTKSPSESEGLDSVVTLFQILVLYHSSLFLPE